MSSKIKWMILIILIQYNYFTIKECQSFKKINQIKDI